MNSPPDQSRVLADRVIAAGVGAYDEYEEFFGGSIAARPHYMFQAVYHTATGFVNDWRVAGELIEKCVSLKLQIRMDETGSSVEAFIFKDKDGSESVTVGRGLNQKQPRDTIEACVEAIEDFSMLSKTAGTKHDVKIDTDSPLVAGAYYEKAEMYGKKIPQCEHKRAAPGITRDDWICLDCESKFTQSGRDMWWCEGCQEQHWWGQTCSRPTENTDD